MGYAAGLSGCDFVVSGSTVTLPFRRELFDMTRTGRIFQNSGNWASLGNSHQNTCRIRGADLSLGFIRGGCIPSIPINLPFSIATKVDSFLPIGAPVSAKHHDLA